MYARITRKCTLHSDWRMQSMLSTNRSSFRWNFTKYSIRLHAFIARLPQNANQHWWRGTEHTLVAQRRNNFSFSLFCINCTSNNEERCAKRKTFSCSPVLTPYAYCRKMETKEAETNADKKEKKGNENQRTRTVGLRRGKIEGINGKIAFSCVKEDFSNFIGLLLYIVGACVCLSTQTLLAHHPNPHMSLYKQSLRWHRSFARRVRDIDFMHKMFYEKQFWLCQMGLRAAHESSACRTQNFWFDEMESTESAMAIRTQTKW